MEIHINPANEPRRVLLALATMLTTLAGEGDAQVGGTLAAADNPSAGKTIPELGVLLGANIIAGMEKRNAEAKELARAAGAAPADLAAAFGGVGNVAGSSATAHSPPPVLIGAGSPTTQTATSAPDVASPPPDLAAAFGGSVSTGPNVAPSPPTSGTPPAPPNGAQTAGASTVELDADGLPWNSEIHSSNKKMAATGKWMARRNVSPVTLERVTAQLRAAVSVGNVQAPAGAPPPPPPLAATPTPIPLPATTPGAAASNAVTLPMLLPRITSAMAAGTLTADSAAAIAMELSGGKINNVAMLAVAPQLIPAFWARLDQLGVAQ